MKKRSACINLVHHSALAGMEYGVTEAFQLPSPTKYHDNLIYPALIQAGVHTFKVSGNSKAGIEKLVNTPGMAGRITATKKDFFEVSDSFKKALEGILLVEQTKEIESLIFRLSFFLTDLSIALDSKSAMIHVVPEPEINDYFGILPLEVIAPIELLLKSIERIEAESPIPQSFILNDSANECLKILDTHSFQQYSETYEALEHEIKLNNSNITAISKSAKSLQSKFTNTLDLKKATITLLPITNQLVDLFAGKIPSIIAGVLCGSLEDYLKEQKRIIIYDYRSTHRYMLMKHYAAVKLQTRSKNN